MSEWQPIETAPKDGTTILAFQKWGKKADQFEMFTVWWNGGWDADINTGWASPSHWMPLPDPPP